MTDYLVAYRSLLDLVLINALLAFSQCVVLRAGVFSIATAGLASIGAYTAANAVVSWGWPAPLGLLGAMLLATAAALLIAVPLARLRGVFQAIATLAFVQLVLSVTQNATTLTGSRAGPARRGSYPAPGIRGGAGSSAPSSATSSAS